MKTIGYDVLEESSVPVEGTVRFVCADESYFEIVPVEKDKGIEVRYADRTGKRMYLLLNCSNVIELLRMKD